MGCNVALMENDIVGNGACNDEANIPECKYDLGDCCLAKIDYFECQDCICHETGEMRPWLEHDLNLELCSPIIYDMGTMDLYFTISVLAGEAADAANFEVLARRYIDGAFGFLLNKK